MSEYVHPIIAVNNAALQSMRNDNINRIHFDHNDFNRLAELVGRDPLEAGELNLAYGGVRKGFGTIRYNPDEEYYQVLQANGSGSDLRHNNFPLHNPVRAQEAGLLMTYPIPRQWTEEQLSWHALHALRFSPPYLKNTLLVTGSFVGVGAAGGAWFAEEKGLAVAETAAWVAVGALGPAALTMAVGITIASQRNTAALRKKAHSLKPFQIIRSRTLKD